MPMRTIRNARCTLRFECTKRCDTTANGCVPTRDLICNCASASISAKLWCVLSRLAPSTPNIARLDTRPVSLRGFKVQVGKEVFKSAGKYKVVDDKTLEFTVTDPGGATKTGSGAFEVSKDKLTLSAKDGKKTEFVRKAAGA